MHRLLARQLKKAGFTQEELEDTKLAKLLEMVEQAYSESDDDRKFYEHTLSVSSQEMRELYEELERRSLSALAKSEARYKELAYHDSLTGILNRHALEEELEKLLYETKRTGGKFAVLFLDLDRFKNINDSYGHDVGDKLLQAVAGRIAPNLRKEDLFARLGGDEFVIVFTNVYSRYALTKMVKKILALFSDAFDVDEHRFFISTSIGVVLYPDDGRTVSDLLKNADIAMYRSKENGRNNFSFFTEELNAEIRFNLELEQRMKQALDAGEFILHFQPQVDMVTKEIIGAEALVRWQHPKFGLLGPERFIPLAESDGFIKSLGRWIIEESCRFIELCNDLFAHETLHVSVNVSLKQLEEELVSIIERSVRKIKPNQLVIEVTESVMSRDIEHTKGLLEQIRDLGVGISMDDFGTGYSSLSYLKELPIHTLKIDKSFVDDISQKRDTECILINSIIALAKSLHLSVIAEGVEKEQQMEYLLEHGCRYAQGYLFGTPVSKDDYFSLLAEA